MARSERGGVRSGRSGGSAGAAGRAPPRVLSVDLVWQLAVVGGLVLAAVVLVAADGADLSHDLRQTLLRVDPARTLVGVTVAVLVLGGASIVRRRDDRPLRRSVTASTIPVVPLLGLVVVAAAASRVLLVRAATEPRVFDDELVYSDLAKGFALHGEPRVRGVLDFGQSLLYPLVLSPAYALAADGAAAFEAAKTLDAVVVTSTAVPAYLLARRVVDPALALVVAALVAFEPWTAYASLVMTESLFLPAFTTFVLLLARMLDRPTVGRQLAVFVALIVLIAIRPQAFALVLGVLAAVAFEGLRGRSPARAVRSHAVLLGALAALAAATAVALAAGTASPGAGSAAVADALLDPVGLVEWSLWNLAVYELALGVVALVVFPVALYDLVRSQDDRLRATGTAMAACSLAILASVALVSTSASGLDVLHERYLFYLTPLVLVGLASWLQGARTLSRRGVAIAAFSAIALAATLPESQVARANNVDSPTAAWLQSLHQTTPSVPTRLLVISLAALGAVVLLVFRRGVAPVLAVVVAFGLLVCGLDYSGSLAIAQDRRLAWVDHALPRRASASLVHLGYSRPDQPCGPAADREQQYFVVLTEFFNTSVADVFHVGEQVERDNLGSPTLTVGTGGVVLDHGRPFAPRYVVLDSRQPVVGRRLGRLDLASLGSAYQAGASLSAWQVDPPLRFPPHAQPLPPRADGGEC